MSQKVLKGDSVRVLFAFLGPGDQLSIRRVSRAFLSHAPLVQGPFWALRVWQDGADSEHSVLGIYAAVGEAKTSARAVFKHRAKKVLKDIGMDVESMEVVKEYEPKHRKRNFSTYTKRLQYKDEDDRAFEGTPLEVQVQKFAGFLRSADSVDRVVSIWDRHERSCPAESGFEMRSFGSILIALRHMVETEGLMHDMPVHFWVKASPRCIEDGGDDDGHCAGGSKYYRASFSSRSAGAKMVCKGPGNFLPRTILDIEYPQSLPTEWLTEVAAIFPQLDAFVVD